MTAEEKKCLECERPIFGRADKKFCSDSCRNAYNNKMNGPSTSMMRNVNHILGKNRRILKELNPKGKLKTHKDKLLMKGFDFEYYTNSYTTQYGDVYRFCYEQGYLLHEDGVIHLVEKDEELQF